MKISNRLKSFWLSLRMIFYFGVKRERIMSHSAKMTIRRWFALSPRTPTDAELERLLHRILLFEEVHGCRPNEQETDGIIQQLLNFPSVS